jgi:hypothetical protein
MNMSLFGHPWGAVARSNTARILSGRAREVLLTTSGSPSHKQPVSRLRQKSNERGAHDTNNQLTDGGLSVTPELK